MRTTLTVDDDVLDTAKMIADMRRISIGQVISELARKGINAREEMTEEVEMKRDPISGFWVFDTPECGVNKSKVTDEDVRRALDAEDQESLKYFSKP